MRLPARRSALACGLLLVLLAPAAAAQPAEADEIPAAETAFRDGLDAYRGGRYEDAYEAFGRAAGEYGFNAKTTAALLMSAKALYAAGDTERAAREATLFLGSFPRSRYADEARALRERARRGRTVIEAPEPVDLGVALPLVAEHAPFTQALFNGIRLAVDAHNEARPERPVRMVFRSSGASPETARDAVGALAMEDVAAIVGPLFSEEALAAAEAAERVRTVLLAPMATDQGVSEGRRWVFQANPTIAARGRYMGLWAAARHARLAVVAQRGTIGATMAEAFRRAAEGAGAEVVLDARLDAAADWSAFQQHVDTLALLRAEAVYFPVAGASADEHAAGALASLDELLDHNPDVRNIRVLGNAEWGRLRASRTLASLYRTTFTDDFEPADTPEAAAFARRYRALSGADPDRLAFAGYDGTRLLLQTLFARRSEEPLADALRAAPPYVGLAQRIYFDGENVNTALFLQQYRDGRAVRAE